MYTTHHAPGGKKELTLFLLWPMQPESTLDRSENGTHNYSMQGPRNMGEKGVSMTDRPGNWCF